MANDSTHTTWFSRMSLVVNLCWKSRRRSAMRAWMRATCFLAFSRFLLALLLLRVAALGARQLLLLLPEEVFVARFLPRRKGHHVLQPQVHPHRGGRAGQGSDLLLHQEGDKVPSSGITTQGDGTRPGITRAAGDSSESGRGSCMRASVKALPSQVNAEVVYSADWRPCFFLNVGYLARPSKKLRKALSKCRRACWGGTQEISFNQP